MSLLYAITGHTSYTEHFKGPFKHKEVEMSISIARIFTVGPFTLQNSGSGGGGGGVAWGYHLEAGC